MASMRDIKRRRDSIQSTGQITKAMKLVSTVKLQRAKGKAESTKPYSDLMYETVSNILAKSGNINHRYLVAGESTKKAVITITGNRGLAGGYNSNIDKLIINSGFNKDDVDIIAIGTKGRDFLKRKGYNIAKDCSDVINEPLYTDAKEICDELLERFAAGEIGEIYLAYTSFKNTVVHIPKLIKLLPVSTEDLKSEEGDKKVDTTPMSYEPEEDEALDMIIPKYVCSLIYGALIESVASENGARMQAMDNATSNAEDLISKLSLQYNRARQGAITQEITEIIGGANATG
ncbi:ATP synthase F1 subunit gamma [Lachnospira multipara]|uniref:ATP synthase gamma chain n=1 Tax=Lachnospira multipara TaxID=28051 RepID=A0A1H5SQG2_9FIRM|nr:ATP synthase F1 subunit gamma [Lachnospira multipara]MBQ2473606.1 ATP synthase F1 subunit gamma [Lachnospira sp.]SEF52081.1 ATP synthase F1 subcomplex gamma subunit [Lachnospira multipara]